MRDKSLLQRLHIYASILAGILLLVNTVVVALLFADVAFGWWPAGGRPGGDLVAHYAASSFVLEGSYSQLYDMPAMTQRILETQGFTIQLPYHYPPIAFFLIAPLALLPFPLAFILWSLAGITAWWYMGFLIGVRRMNWLLFLAYPAFFVCLVCGQNGWLTALLVVGGYSLLTRHPLVAGLVLSALSYKPQFVPVVALALLAGSHWRALRGMTLGVGLLIALSLLCFGAQPWEDFFADITFTQQLTQKNLLSFERMPTATALFVSLGLPTSLRFPAQLFASLLVGALVFLLWNKTTDPKLRLAALCFGILGAAPFAFEYDLPIVGVGVMCLAQALGSIGGKAWGWAFVIFLWAYTYLRLFLSVVLALNLGYLCLSAGLVLCLYLADKTQKTQ